MCILPILPEKTQDSKLALRQYNNIFLLNLKLEGKLKFMIKEKFRKYFLYIMFLGALIGATVTTLIYS